MSGSFVIALIFGLLGFALGYWYRSRTPMKKFIAWAASLLVTSSEVEAATCRRRAKVAVCRAKKELHPSEL